MKNRAKPECVAQLHSRAAAIENNDTLAIQIAHERIDVPRRAELNIEHGGVVDGEDIEFQIKTITPKQQSTRLPNAAVSCLAHCML